MSASRNGMRVATRGNRLGVPETELGRMQYHPNGQPIDTSRVRTPVNPGPVDSAIKSLCRAKAAPFVRAWMDYAKPQNLDKFRRVMASIATNMHGRQGRIEDGTMETTYMADISRNITTRYLGPTAAIDPSEKGQLYARHIFKPEVLPRVSQWLVGATEKERDAFRDAFASLTTYYKRRKGPRSEYASENKNKDPDFRARMREHDDRDAEFANRTLRQIEEDAQYHTTSSNLGAGVRSAGGEHFNNNSAFGDGDDDDFGGRYESAPARGGSSRASSRPDSRSSVDKLLHTSASLREIDRNQQERRRVEQEGAELVSRVRDHYGYLIKPKAMATLQSWVNFARTEYKRGLEKLLHNIKKTASQGPSQRGDNGGRRVSTTGGAGGSSSALVSSTYTTTTGEANAMATRGFASSEARVAADQLVRLYGKSFFREPAWPVVALHLGNAPPAEVDLYRQVFSSFASYHDERKGPRSLNATDFKVESRKKKEALRASRDTLEAHGMFSATSTGVASRGINSRSVKLASDDELAQKRAQILDTLRSTAHMEIPKGHLGRKPWKPGQTGPRGNAAAPKMTARDARPEPVGDMFSKPEQQSTLGPIRGHGGFFSKTEAQMSHTWKVAEPDDIAIAIKAKNTKGNDPLGGVGLPGVMESSYRGTYKGVRGDRPKAVSAEFYS